MQRSGALVVEEVNLDGGEEEDSSGSLSRERQAWHLGDLE
jgi:hypothetical protein